MSIRYVSDQYIYNQMIKWNSKNLPFSSFILVTALRKVLWMTHLTMRAHMEATLVLKVIKDVDQDETHGKTSRSNVSSKLDAEPGRKHSISRDESNQMLYEVIS